MERRRKQALLHNLKAVLSFFALFQLVMQNYAFVLFLLVIWTILANANMGWWYYFGKRNKSNNN